jgi:Fe(3+) dicitrate transport protein
MIFVMLSSSAFAADKKTGETITSEILMREVSIIGSKSAVKDIAGSAAYLDVQDIRTQNVEDVNRILRRVPGVSIREEDGYGLFPNISLRGVDPARSSKVTIMEDGVLMAPAPYSAPSAYYSPNTGRMSGIEVLKGSSQVKYGPHTTGGAINFLSTPIPTTSQAYSKNTFGQFNELRNHTYFGDTLNVKNGKFGYLIEYYTRTNTGFKNLAEWNDNTLVSQTAIQTPDIRGEQNTGFTRQEPMLKLMWEPKSGLYQRFEAKFGFSNLDANETYTGLNTADFYADPYRRMAATRFDEIESTQYRSYLRHLIELSSNTSIVTTLYGNTFNRNWQKANKFGNDSQSECLADPTLACYKIAAGTGAGTFTLKNNNRSYYMYGAQVDLKHKLQLGAIEHNLNLNVRHHYDQIRRKQWEETYTQNAAGAITAASVNARGNTSTGNRLQRTHATAVNFQDTMKTGRVTFSPGMRVEIISQDRCKASTTCANDGGRTASDMEEAGTYAIWTGGANAKIDLLDRDGQDLDVFAGAFRGMSPAGPSSRIDKHMKPETSIGIEVGTRYADAKKAFSTELTLFHTKINDLQIPDSIGGTGATAGENAGDVRSMGIELAASYDPGLHHNWAYQLPMWFAATGTDAEIRSDVGSTDEESYFAGGKKGNQLPYIPQFQVGFGIGVIYQKFNLNFDASYVSEAFADAANTSSNGKPTTGQLNERFGKIDDRLVVDAAMGYQINNKVRAFANAKNIFDEVYMVSRQPHGPRPGMPFNVMAGLEFSL